MNALHHDFVIFENGVDAWVFVAIGFAILEVVIGLRKYRLAVEEDRSIRIRRRRNREAALRISAIIAVVVLTVMMFKESYVGVLQWFDNGLTRYESGVWSVLGAAFAIPAAAVVLGVVIYCFGKLTSWARLGYLIEKKRKMTEIENSLRD